MFKVSVRQAQFILNNLRTINCFICVLVLSILFTDPTKATIPRGFLSLVLLSKASRGSGQLLISFDGKLDRKGHPLNFWLANIDSNAPFQVFLWYPSLMNRLLRFPNMQRLTRVTNKQIFTIPNSTHRFKGHLFAKYYTENNLDDKIYTRVPSPCKRGVLRVHSGIRYPSFQEASHFCPKGVYRA